MSRDRLATVNLRDARLIRILEAALQSVEPAHLVADYLRSNGLPPHSRCFMLGMGKAAEAMTHGAAEIIGDFEAALVITKQSTSASTQRFTILEAGHPIPDERSLAAGQAVLDFVAHLQPEDLLLCLISGGGSSLVTAPAPGVSLSQLQELSSQALASGADINEINNLRRCLDRLKGGGLASATQARILGLVLSDVIGDPIESVASGPTVPSQPDPIRAASLLIRLNTGRPTPLSALLASWTPPSTQGAEARTTNVVIGNAATAAASACAQARREGFAAEVLDAPFVGEARDVGQHLARHLASRLPLARRPACLIAYGESTVSLGQDPGKGGRNQELALAAANQLAGMKGCLLVALATDGEDGPTDAAGAVVTDLTDASGAARGMRTEEYLARHDAYHYFEALGDLLKPGPTGTNVNDLVVMFAL